MVNIQDMGTPAGTLSTKDRLILEGIRLFSKNGFGGTTTRMLADAIGVSEVYVSMIERGMKMPSLSLFAQIITVLDVSADFVLRDALPSGKDFVYKEVAELLDSLTPKQRRAAIDILDAYVRSL